MPSVSVIIPTFDRKRFLAEALDSVRAQTFADVEVVVVDDGSTDGTEEMLLGFAGVRCIRQENRGVSSARNEGIRSSAGELVAFLDSDDLWKPEKLARQVDYHREHPDAWISQTGEVWIRNGKRQNPRNRHRKFGGWIFRECLPLCIVSPSAVMMKRELFREVGLFDESLPACEDYDMWLRVSSRFPIHLVPEPLVVKRGGHPDQLSASVEALDRYRIRALQKILDGGSLCPDDRAAALEELERKCRIYAQGCVRRGRNEEAASCARIPEAYSVSSWTGRTCRTQ
jgi:glycosyltransferase involved in cell wall biosynthesis